MADPKGIPEKLKIPQWRLVIAALFFILLFYLWGEFFGTVGPPRQAVTYTQFMEQLEAANIKSVSIKKLRVQGEFVKEVSIPLPGEPKAVAVKNFRTFLPSFQGEDLLAKLREKNVAITVEPEQDSVFWQILLGLLPWLLIIGVWI